MFAQSPVVYPGFRGWVHFYIGEIKNVEFFKLTGLAIPQFKKPISWQVWQPLPFFRETSNSVLSGAVCCCGRSEEWTG